LATARPAQTGLKIGPVAGLTPDLSAPLLGLLGAEDAYPDASQVAELRQMFGERRAARRRGVAGVEVDELAERLAAAFAVERRVRDRRVS